MGKLPLFDCILQGCSARVFADIVGVFSYTILYKPVQNVWQTSKCYTCTLIVNLVMT